MKVKMNDSLLSDEVRQLAAKIEFKARKIADGLLLGAGSSKQHGFGFDFDQLRPYQLGDDIRFIDWRASTRSNTLLVKQYFQERNRVIGILLDCSRSMSFSTTDRSKAFVAAQTAILLAIIAEKGSDQLVAIGYSGEIEWVLPRSKGRRQTRQLLDLIVQKKYKSGSTKIANAVQEIQRVGSHKMLLFVISDCIEPHLARHLQPLLQKHEVIVLRILDSGEQSIGDVGYLMLEDFESGETLFIHTGGASYGSDIVTQFVHKQKQELLRYGIDVSTINPAEGSLEAVAGFLLNRINK